MDSAMGSSYSENFDPLSQPPLRSMAQGIRSMAQGIRSMAQGITMHGTRHKISLCITK